MTKKTLEELADEEKRGFEKEALEAELEKVEQAEFMMSMSDNFCYTTGRIYPLKRKIAELKAQIADRLVILSLLNGE